MPPLNLTSSASSKSGDIYTSNQFSTGSFGGGSDLGQFVKDNWLYVVAAVAAYVIYRKRNK